MKGRSLNSPIKDEKVPNIPEEPEYLENFSSLIPMESNNNIFSIPTSPNIPMNGRRTSSVNFPTLDVLEENISRSYQCHQHRHQGYFSSQLEDNSDYYNNYSSCRNESNTTSPSFYPLHSGIFYVFLYTCQGL